LLALETIDLRVPTPATNYSLKIILQMAE